MGLTYGEQDADEKAETIRKFSAGELDVLVSTTVIEVGVNVPSATVMVIENADRFGLSQLHQLRGRVGRGAKESWCFLMAAPNERLKTLCETSDGFRIAQKDLELRGPGDLAGTRQSGEPGNGFLFTDIRLLDEVTQCVQNLRRDPALKAEKKAIEESAASFFATEGRRVALN